MRPTTMLLHPESAAGVPAPTPHAEQEVPHAVGAKETVISLIIAFALAFVFRGYVVEPYVIPTNSMAPTLLGAHIRWVNPTNGYDWPTSHFFAQSNGAGGAIPSSQQGGTVGGQNMGPLVTYDPMTRQPLQFDKGLPIRSGDRIFVLRYVWPIFTPQRWDVVVFKTPTPAETGSGQSTGATQAYIKRLLGLPGEEFALFDGDVFTRPNDGAPTPAGKTRWDLPDWKIQPKDERSQRAVWQPIFDSRYAISTTAQGAPFQGPFVGEGSGWEIAGKTAYTYSGAGPTRLLWDMTHDRSIDFLSLLEPNQQLVQRFHHARTRWSLTDSYPMDEILPPIITQNLQRQEFLYPVSDLRLSAGVEPKNGSFSFAAVIRTRGHEFRARLSVGTTGSTNAGIQTRPIVDGQGAEAGWQTLATKDLGTVLAAGKVSNVDFWHHDQRLELWIENQQALQADYGWGLAERVQRVFGKSIAEVLAVDKPGTPDMQVPGRLNPGYFGTSANYCRPELWFEASGPVTMHRVAVARDLFYQPILGSVGGFSFFISNGAHPTLALKALGPDQYFTCGDNSPMSSDARRWNTVDRWVASEIDPTLGVINKRLMVGKAFFVYFPAIQSRQVLGTKIPMVDAGRMRWIW
jgi:signal peptidase I